MADSIPESNHGAQPHGKSDGKTPATLTGKHRAYDEAAAQLVAAWDTDIDAHAPASGEPARDHLSPPVSSPEAATASTWEGGPARRSAMPRVMALGAAGLAALVVGWWALQGDDVPETPTTANQAAPAAAAAAEAASAPASTRQPSAAADADRAATETSPLPAEPAVPERFALTVRTIPPGAQLEVDGTRVKNPYVGEHQADAVVRLTATAKGHEPAEREIELDEDINLMVTLTPQEEPKARSRVDQRRARKRAERRRRARARRAQKARAARKRRAKKKTAGFVSSNPYQ